VLCAQLGVVDGTENAVKTTVGIAGLHPWSPRHFCVTNFSASLTLHTALVPRSHVCSCYITRLQKHTDLRAHDFAHSPNVWRQGVVSLTLSAPEPEDFMELCLLYFISGQKVSINLQRSGIEIRTSTIYPREWRKAYNRRRIAGTIRPDKQLPMWLLPHSWGF
jgi:hypothetical protein